MKIISAITNCFNMERLFEYYDEDFFKFLFKLLNELE